MTNVYLDTEFTDFINTQLISIGLVADNGAELYLELTDYDRRASSEFVKLHVEPLLDHAHHGASAGEAAVLLSLWLDDLPQPLTLCVDYLGDLNLLHELLGDIETEFTVSTFVLLHEELQAVTVRQATVQGLDADQQHSFYLRAKAKVTATLEASRQAHGKQHHALEDARDLRKAFEALADFELSQSY